MSMGRKIEKREAAFQTRWNRWLRSGEGKRWVVNVCEGEGDCFSEADGRGGLIRRAGGFAMALELKVVKCDGRGGGCLSGGVCASRLGLSKIEEGQWEALKCVNSGFSAKDGYDCLVYKISDLNPGYKPMDMFFMGGGVPAGFVIAWLCDGAGEQVGWLPIERALEYKTRAVGGRGSIGFEECERVLID